MACEDSGAKNHINAFVWLNKVELKDGRCETAFWNIVSAPRRVTIRARSFKFKLRKGSFIGRMEIQLIHLPPITAPLARKIIGVVLDKELSVVY